MNIAKMLLTKVGKVFLVILATFRRALCCIRRRRRNSDTPLPFTTADRHLLTAVHPTSGGVQPFASSEVGLDWSSWGTSVAVDRHSELLEHPTSVAVAVDQLKQHETRSSQSYVAQRYNRQQSNNSETEPEVDFFQDMVPAIRRPAKIIIKKHDDSSLSRDGLSERLAVDPQLASGVGELGHWEETESTWEDSMDAEIDCVDTDSVLRESKMLERERRAADHLRRKQEKDAVRIVRSKDHLATKIS